MKTAWLVTVMFLFFSRLSFSADCEDIFPDAAQNSSSGGEINVYWNSRIFNSPDNILDTRNFYSEGPPGRSCDGVDCTESGSVVPTGDITSYPTNQPNVNVGYQQTRTLSPGSYNGIYAGTQATLNMQPGIYVVRNNFVMDYQAQLVVTGPGTVTIYVRRDISIRTQARINSANVDRYVFLFSRRDVSLFSNSETNAVIYARDDVFLGNGAEVTGAVTARDTISLESSSFITFDSNAAQNTDYGNGFCSQDFPPNLIAEWRLDALEWTGASGEVLDYSGNNLHGSLVSVSGNLPTTQINDPAVPGDPGTCRSGDFSGTSAGYVRIDDPGSGSIFDLSELSVSAWIYPRAYATTSGLMTIASKDENWEFHINRSGGIFWWWGGGSRSLTASTPLALNTWHHIVITFEPGEQVIYVNGVARATRNSTQSLTLNNDPVFIGTDLNYDSRNFDGFIDEVRIYDGPLSSAEVATVMADTHPCIPEPGLDYFDIDIGSGTASTCSPQEISITARTSTNAILTDYAGTISLSTSTNNGDWLKSASPADALGVISPLNDNDDNGAASYAFESSGLDQGEITLNLSNEHAETLTIVVADNAAGIFSTYRGLTFSENAFVVSSLESVFGDDIVAGRSHNFRVQMVKRDPTTGVCGPAKNYNTSDVKAWINRGAGDPGGAGPQVQNAAASDTEVLGSSAPAINNFTLPFVNGQADFTLNASDVGRYTLQFMDDSLTFSDQIISGGSSSTYVARPFGFYINAAGNPGAVNENGTVFTTAGTDFTVAVTAVAWESGDDTNNDGVPDGHDNTDPSDNSDLSNNSVLISFGQENPTESITLSASLFLPSGGAGNFNSSLPSSDARIVTAFSNGTGSTSAVHFTEVGIIELQAVVSDTDYLGANASVTSTMLSKSGYVGRFTPSNFELRNLSISPSCSSGLPFSYMDQTFSVSYDVEAVNSLGNITSNYNGAFVKLSSTAGSISAGARNAVTTADLSNRLDTINTLIRESTSFSWVAGLGNLESEFHLDRASTPDGPFNRLEIGVVVSDSDAVTVATSDLNLDVNNDISNDYISAGETAVYFGRLRLSDSFGPETANLPVNFSTEYWDGSVWRLSDQDGCTTISLSSINYPNGAISNGANRTVTIGSGSTTGMYATINSTDISFSAGDAGHYFTAPGVGNIGSFNVDVDLTLYPWLRFDWNADGSYDDTALPTATFTFGSYRGHDRIIYWQEVLN